MSNRLTVMYRAGISAERVREITGADDVSIMTWNDVFAERNALRAEVERLREIREIASQCAANGGYLSSADLIELRELLKK